MACKNLGMANYRSRDVELSAADLTELLTHDLDVTKLVQLLHAGLLRAEANVIGQCLKDLGDHDETPSDIAIFARTTLGKVEVDRFGRNNGRIDEAKEDETTDAAKRRDEARRISAQDSATQ